MTRSYSRTIKRKLALCSLKLGKGRTKSHISNGSLQKEAWKDVLQNVGAPKTHIDALTSSKLYHTSSKFVLPNSTYECCCFRHLQHPLHGNDTKTENYLHLHCTRMVITFFTYVDANTTRSHWCRGFQIIVKPNRKNMFSFIITFLRYCT